MGPETPTVENHRLRKDQVTPPTQRFIVGVLRPAVGIKHVFWVVGSKFIYAAELNELLINAERQEQQEFNVNLAPLCVRAAELLSRAAYLGFRNSFFFWMWLFVSKSPSSFLSYSL